MFKVGMKLNEYVYMIMIIVWGKLGNYSEVVDLFYDM